MESRRNEAKALAARPYTIVAEPSETTDGEPSWVAYVMELEGCKGQGQNEEEAVADARLVMVDFIETMLEYGVAVPEPQRPRTSTVGAKVAILKFDQSDLSGRREETRRVGEFVISTVSAV